jgi:hypothetical protein
MAAPTRFVFAQSYTLAAVAKCHVRWTALLPLHLYGLPDLARDLYVRSMTVMNFVRHAGEFGTGLVHGYDGQTDQRD